jgi:hypothetical protein
MEIMALKIAATEVAARTIRQAHADAFMIAPPIVLPAVFIRRPGVSLKLAVLQQTVPQP